MRYLLAVALLCGASFQAHAASNPDLCRTVAGPAATAATELRGFDEAMEQLAVLGQMSSTFEGEELAALEALEGKRVAAKAAISEFVDELEDAAYVMQRCARG